MYKKLLILSLLVCFVMDIGVSSAGPPMPVSQQPPKEVKPTVSQQTLMKPDLIISEIKFQNVIDKGNCEFFDVIIDVKNIGVAPSGPCNVLLEKKVEPNPNFKIVDEMPVSSLAKGETVSLPPRKFNTCEGVKQYIFRATADSKNSVAESNEDNNSKTATYSAVEKK